MHKLRLLLTLAISSAESCCSRRARRPCRPARSQATSSFDYTKNLHPQGFSAFPNTPNLPGLTFTANWDLAFWGKYAFQGHYEGFRILNISSPAKPRQISFTECFGNQGDVVVWGDILVRSWNSPATGTGSSQLSCDGEPVPLGSKGCTSSTSATARIPSCRGGDQRRPRLTCRVRLPHGDGRAGPREQPPGRLQPDVRRAPVPRFECDPTIFEVPLDDPGSASSCARSRSRAACLP